MKKLIVLGGITLLLLTGCSYTFNFEEKQKEVEEYNKIVESTIKSYEECRKFAEQNKQDVIDYVIKGVDIDVPIEYKELDENNLDDIKYWFKQYGVVHDYYFTAFGVENIREIIYIVGIDKRVTINIVWGKDKIIYLGRKVFDL